MVIRTCTNIILNKDNFVLEPNNGQLKLDSNKNLINNASNFTDGNDGNENMTTAFIVSQTRRFSGFDSRYLLSALANNTFDPNIIYMTYGPLLRVRSNETLKYIVPSDYLTKTDSTPRIFIAPLMQIKKKLIQPGEYQLIFSRLLGGKSNKYATNDRNTMTNPTVQLENTTNINYKEPNFGSYAFYNAPIPLSSMSDIERKYILYHWDGQGYGNGYGFLNINPQNANINTANADTNLIIDINCDSLDWNYTKDIDSRTNPDLKNSLAFLNIMVTLTINNFTKITINPASRFNSAFFNIYYPALFTQLRALLSPADL